MFTKLSVGAAMLAPVAITSWFFVLPVVSLALSSEWKGEEVVFPRFSDDGGMSLLQHHVGRYSNKPKPDMSVSMSQAVKKSAFHWPDMDYWPDSVRKPKYSVTRPIYIVSWTDYVFLSLQSAKDTPNCTFDMLYDKHMPVDGGVISDPDFDLSKADVVLFSLSRLVNRTSTRPPSYILPRTKRKGQLWIALCGEPTDRPESGVDCRLKHDRATMDLMDGYSSFSIYSDFPAVQDPIHEDILRLPVPDFEARERREHTHAWATATISDCAEGDRKKWLEDVMRVFEAKGHKDAVLSYGNCLHNAEEPATGEERVWINREASRPFKLVAENTIEQWYVTEKVWDALGEGTIPVYWGPPEVKRWVPPNSIIYARDFNSTEELVDHMLSFSSEDFEEARAWKRKPTSEWGGWERAWELSHATLLPRICEGAAHMLDKRDKRSVPLHQEMHQHGHVIVHRMGEV